MISWPIIMERMRECERCGLHAARQSVVIGECYSFAMLLIAVLIKPRHRSAVMLRTNHKSIL